MTDREFAHVQRHCLRLFGRWRQLLALEHYEMTYEWWREGGIKDAAEPDVSTSMRTVMDVESSWMYMKAVIRVDCALALDMSVAELDQTIAHELLHVVLKEMQPQRVPAGYKDHEEHVVEWLARRLVALAPAPKMPSGGGKKGSLTAG